MTPTPAQSISHPRRARLSRAMGIAAALAVIAAPLTVGTAAVAAPGDYTIQLQSPATVSVNQQFTETISINCPDGGCAGVVIRQQLPAELRYVNVPTGPTATVASVSGGTALGATLEFTLNDIVTAGVATFSVALVNDFSVTTDVSPSSSWTLTATSGTVGQPGFQTASSTTVPTGNIALLVGKAQETVPGSDNRRVTYTFTPRILAPRVGRFAPSAPQLVDTLPEHAVVLEASNGGLPGAWTSAPGPDNSTTWTFTGTGVYAPPAPTVDINLASPRLVVYYPSEHFPAGTRPPLNTVTFDAAYRDDARSSRVSGSTQGPQFGAGGMPSVYLGAEKVRTSTGSLTNNTYFNTVRVRGAVNDSTGNGVRGFVMTDDSNDTFFDHAYVESLSLSFSPELADLAAPWEFELRYSDSPSWVTVSTGTTDASATVCPRVTGSSYGGTCRVDRPAGTALTGWRLTISPDAADPALVNASVATVNVRFAPLWRSVSTGEPPVDNRIDNTVTVTGRDGGTGGVLAPVTDDFRMTISDAVYTPVTVAVSPTLTVGAPGQYVQVSLANAHDTPIEGCVATMLPLGTHWDGSAATNVTGSAPPGSTAPGIATMTLHGQTPLGQDIIMVCFDAPFAPTIDGNIPTGHNSLVSFRIPITVLPSAYTPPTSDTRQARAFAVITSPTHTPPGGAGQFYASDVYDVDPTRSAVNAATTTTSILSDGSLQLEKLVSVDSGASWALVGETTAPSTSLVWRIGFYNMLPSGTASDVELCDWLPQTGDGRGSEFALELSGPVTGVPAGGSVAYGTTALGCSDPDIVWSSDWAGANTFRVLVPTVASSASFAIDATTDVPAGTLAFLSATNSAEGAATVAGLTHTGLTSNTATVSLLASPAFALEKRTNGVAYDTAPGSQVATGSAVTWTFEITNTGNTLLEGFAISDLFTAGDGSTGTVAVDTSSGGRIQPGQSVAFTATGTAIEGQYENVATASATSVAADGTPLTQQPTDQTDSSWYLATTTPVVPPAPVIIPGPPTLGELGLTGTLATAGLAAALLALGTWWFLAARRRRGTTV